MNEIISYQRKNESCVRVNNPFCTQCDRMDEDLDMEVVIPIVLLSSSLEDEDNCQSTLSVNHPILGFKEEIEVELEDDRKEDQEIKLNDPLNEKTVNGKLRRSNSCDNDICYILIDSDGPPLVKKKITSKGSRNPRSKKPTAMIKALIDKAGGALKQATQKRVVSKRRVFKSFSTPDPMKGDPKYRNVPTIGTGVCVKNSSIIGAGRGLYACRPFKRGELVTEYAGEIISRDEAQRRAQRGEFQFLGTLVSGMYEIDGLQEPVDGKGAASFINHAASSRANVKWSHLEDQLLCFTRLFAKAVRDIKDGEEILINYGNTFWRRHKKWKLAVDRGLHLLSDVSSSSLSSSSSRTQSDGTDHRPTQWAHPLTGESNSESSSLDSCSSLDTGDDGVAVVVDSIKDFERRKTTDERPVKGYAHLYENFLLRPFEPR